MQYSIKSFNTCKNLSLNKVNNNNNNNNSNNNNNNNRKKDNIPRFTVLLIYIDKDNKEDSKGKKEEEEDNNNHFLYDKFLLNNSLLYNRLEILATWCHEKMNEIEHAFNVLKLAYDISRLTLPNDFVKSDNIINIRLSIKSVKFLKNYQMDNNIQLLIQDNNNDNDDYNELIDGAKHLIKLINSFTIVLKHIEKKISRLLTGLQLSNEINKLMKLDAGITILAVFDLNT